MGNSEEIKLILDENLLWLMNWYHQQCDGDWEHQFGVKIETLDNPGWSIQISIYETELQDKKFQVISIERTNENWIFCEVENGFFKANCSVFNLREILQVFRDWAESK